MIETVDTLAYFFSVNDFGTEATFTPTGGSPSTVVGIHENPYLSADAGGMVEFTATSPTFTARDADFPSVKYGDALVVGGVTYAITEIMPDGTGLTTLSLEEQ